MCSENPKMISLMQSDLWRILEFHGKSDYLTRIKTIISAPYLAAIFIRLTYHCNLNLGTKPFAKLFQILLFLGFKIIYSPKIKIGPALFLPHPQNIVLGCFSIGARVTIMQSVTLGAKRLDNGFDAKLRPILSDDIFVGAHSIVLGGGVISNGQFIKAGEIVIL